MKTLHQCYKCDKIAVWMYMPASDCIEIQRFLCDNHVSRGCSCNIINDETGEEDVDKFGRLLPCCEYDYSENGYDDE